MITRGRSTAPRSEALDAKDDIPFKPLCEAFWRQGVPVQPRSEFRWSVVALRCQIAFRQERFVKEKVTFDNEIAILGFRSVGVVPCNIWWQATE